MINRYQFMGIISIITGVFLLSSCEQDNSPPASPAVGSPTSSVSIPSAGIAVSATPTATDKPGASASPNTGIPITPSPSFALPTLTPTGSLSTATPSVQGPPTVLPPVLPSGNATRDADLKLLLDTVPEIEAYRKDMLKINPEFKLVITLATGWTNNAVDGNANVFAVQESQSSQNVTWNQFLVSSANQTVKIMDNRTGDYISLEAWRAAAAPVKKSWNVQFGTHAYKVTVSIDGAQQLQVEADETGGKVSKLFSEAFGTMASLEVSPLESADGTKTLLISAASGNSGDDRRSTVLTWDTKTNQLAFSLHPFSKLNATRLAELIPQIKDTALKEWVVGKFMGFRTGRFQAYTPTSADTGTVTYNIGSLPVLAMGKAEVKYNFNEQQFQLTAITSSTFENALASPACSNIVKVQDPQFGEILAWSELKSAYRFAGINAAYLAQAAACGESLDKPFKNGSSYLIESISRYKDKPEILKGLLDAWKVNTQHRDKNGLSPYAIALAAGVTDPLLLDRLREGFTKAQATTEEQSVKLALHGSILPLDEIKAIVKNGVSVNTNMSDYAYLLSQQDSDFYSGTVLGSAIMKNDLEKVKWLLENGADVNMKFGSGEFSQSPLRAALAKDLKLAELLLEHKANGDEVYSIFPVQLSLLAGNRCSSEKVALLKKYGATKWMLYDPDPSLKTDYKTEEEIMKLTCK